MTTNRVKQANPVSERYYYPQAPVQKRVRLVTEAYEYEAPFKYANITVKRFDMMGRESHGVEMNMVNYHHPQGEQEPHDLEADSITLVEKDPIVRVVVMGSACTPPGYVQLECDPIPEWRNTYEIPGVLPPRFRINNLWGMHVRVDALYSHTPDVKPPISRVDESGYDQVPEPYYDLYKSARGKLFLKHHCRENPLAGMSCAIFEIPPSRTVIIQGGSEVPGWGSDNFPGDHHYSFRTIRTTVQLRREEVD